MTSAMGPSSFAKRAQIWHAFNVLDEQKKGEVLKSQLKVLSHNLMTALGITEANNAIEAFLPSALSLSFIDYMRFIDEMLSKTMRANSLMEEASILMDKVDTVCWFICSKSYVSQTGRLLDENNCFKLWCIFNILAHADSDEEPICPVTMDYEEAEILLLRIHRILGIVFNKEAFQKEVSVNGQLYSFPQMLKLLEKYLFGVDSKIVSSVVSELYEEYVLGVLKKGYLTKKGHIIMSWKERWCVLMPTCLRYFVSREEKELKGEIKITAKCTVENLSDKMGAKQNRFLVKSEGKDYEICAPDSITKKEWIAAFTMAISFHTSSGQTGLTKAEIQQRRISRLARRAKLTEEQKQNLRQKELMDMTQQQLEQEIMKRSEMENKAREEEEKRLREQELVAKTKEELDAVNKARAQAEARWAEEAAQHELERQHLRELQELHRQLELQLEKERHAREQEELSRKLQEEITREELLKKKELEEIQASLTLLLVDEKQKREDLEEAKLRQEALLHQEKLRLEKLEMERKQRDLEYQAALEKLQQAEREKEEAQSLLRKKKETPFGSALFKFIEGEANDQILVNPGSHRGRGFLKEDDFQAQ